MLTQKQSELLKEYSFWQCEFDYYQNMITLYTAGGLLESHNKGSDNKNLEKCIESAEYAAQKMVIAADILGLDREYLPMDVIDRSDQYRWNKNSKK